MPLENRIDPAPFSPSTRNATSTSQRHTYRSLFDDLNATRNKYYHNPITAHTQDSMARVNAILVGIDEEYSAQAANLDEVSTLEDGSRRVLMAKIDERLRRPLDFDFSSKTTSVTQSTSAPAPSVVTLGEMRGFEPPNVKFKSKDDAWLGVAEPIPAKDLFFVDTKDVIQSVRALPEKLVPAAGPKRSIFEVISTLNSMLADLHTVLLQASVTTTTIDELSTKHDTMIKMIDDCIAKDKGMSSGHNLSVGSSSPTSPTHVDMERLEMQLRVSKQHFHEALLQIKAVGKQAIPTQHRECPANKMQASAGALMQTASQLRDQLAKFQESLDVRSAPSEIIIKSLRQKLFNETSKVAALKEELIRYKVTARFRQNARQRRETAGEPDRAHFSNQLSPSSPTAPQATSSPTSCFSILHSKAIVSVAADDVQLIKENLPTWCSDRLIELFCDAVLLLIRSLPNENANAISSSPTILKADYANGSFLIAFEHSLDAQRFAFDLQYVLLCAPWPREALQLVLPDGYAPLSALKGSETEVLAIGQLTDEPSRNFCRFVDDYVLSEKKEQQEAERLRSIQRMSTIRVPSPPVSMLGSYRNSQRRRSPIRAADGSAPATISARAKQVLSQLAQRYPLASNLIDGKDTYIFRGLRSRIGIDIGDVVIEGSDPTSSDPDELQRLGNDEVVVKGVYGQSLLRASVLTGVARGGEIVLSKKATEQLRAMSAKDLSDQQHPSRSQRTDSKYFCAPMSQHSDQMIYYSSHHVTSQVPVFAIDEEVYCMLPLDLLYRCYHFLAEPTSKVNRRKSGISYNPCWFMTFQVRNQTPKSCNTGILSSAYRGGGSSAAVSEHTPNAYLFRKWAAFVSESCPATMTEFISRTSCPMSTAEEAQAAIYAVAALHSIAMSSSRIASRMQNKLKLLDSHHRAEATRLLSQHDMCPIDAAASMLTQIHISQWEATRNAEINDKGSSHSFVYESLSSPVSQFLYNLYLHHRTTSEGHSRRGSVALDNCIPLSNPKSLMRMTLCGGWELLGKQQVGKMQSIAAQDATRLMHLAASVMVMECLDEGKYTQAYSLRLCGPATNSNGSTLWRAVCLAVSIAYKAQSASIHWCHWNQMVLASTASHSPYSLLIDPLAVRSSLMKAQRNIKGFLTPSTTTTFIFAASSTPTDTLQLPDIVLYFALLHVSGQQLTLQTSTESSTLLNVDNMMVTRTGSAVPSSSKRPSLRRPSSGGSTGGGQYTHLESLALLSQHSRALTGATLSMFDRLLAFPNEHPESALITLQHCGYREGSFMLCSVENGIGQFLKDILQPPSNLRDRKSSSESDVTNNELGQSLTRTQSPQNDLAERLSNGLLALLGAFEAQYAIAPLYMLPVMDVATSARFLRQEYNNTGGEGVPDMLGLSALIAGGTYQQQLLHFITPLATPLALCGGTARPFTTVQVWAAQLARTVAGIHAAGFAAGVISSTYSLFLRNEADTANLFLAQAGLIHYIASYHELVREAKNGEDGSSTFEIKKALEELPPEYIITSEEAALTAKANQMRRSIGAKLVDTPAPTAISHLMPFQKAPSKAIESYVDGLVNLTRGMLDRSGETQVDLAQSADVWQYGLALFEMVTGCTLWQVLRMTSAYSDVNYKEEKGTESNLLNLTKSSGGLVGPPSAVPKVHFDQDIKSGNAMTMSYLEKQYGSILRAGQNESSPIFPTLLDAFRALRLGLLTANGVALKVFDVNALWPNILGSMSHSDGTKVGKDDTFPSESTNQIEPFKLVVEEEDTINQKAATPPSQSAKRHTSGAHSLDPKAVVVEQTISLILLSDLLQRVLQVNPKHRPTMMEVLAHPFFMNVPHVVMSGGEALSQWLLNKPVYVCPYAAGHYATLAPTLVAVLGNGNADGLFQLVEQGACLCDSGAPELAHAPATMGALLLNTLTHPMYIKRRANAVAALRAESERRSVRWEDLSDFFPQPLMTAMSRN